MGFFEQWQVFFVAMLGALTGCIELIGRYRDAPFRALRTGGASAYIGVNVVAAISCLFLLQTIGANLIQEADPQRRAIYEVLIAGFGSLAILRTALFKTKINDTEVSIGPAGLLDVLLTAADRSVDRSRASQRVADAAEIMKDVSFDKAIATLPTFCIGLMQNMTTDDQTSILRQVGVIQGNVAVDPYAKSVLLGTLLMRFVGLDVLRTAAKQLGPSISYDVPQLTPPLEPSLLMEMLVEVEESVTRDPSRE